MGLLLSPAILCFTLLQAPPEAPQADGPAATTGLQTEAIEVNVLVLNFDPMVPSQDGRLVRLHDALGWNDPRTLADGYVADIGRATRGHIRLRIARWEDLDQFPVKTDGFRYTPEMYLACHKTGQGWHQPDQVDYEKVIEEHAVIRAIAAKEADEVWLFGAPYFGYWESAMAGPRSFYINGGPLPEVPSDRPFAIMGFNYERGVAEMLHNLCHRVESTMSHFTGGWKVDRLTNDWARFASNAAQSGGQAGCGTCHYPPNGTKDYDYQNPGTVLSTADDWLNYPRLTGRKTPVNCETWGGPDYQRNYFVWWYERFPRAADIHPRTRTQNDWWKYVFRFDDYDVGGLTRRR